MLELKEVLQKQLDDARDKLTAAEVQLADSRKQGEALAAKLKTAEEAKTEAEKVGRAWVVCSIMTHDGFPRLVVASSDISQQQRQA